MAVETNLAAGHADFYLSGTVKGKLFIICQGHEAWNIFFPKLWKYLSFILSGTCGQERYFCFFVLVATDVTFSISALLWLIVCFFLKFFLLLYFPGTPSLCICLPRSLLFPLLCYPLLSLLLAPSPSSVRWENWPHKKWKGLFKRNGRIMKTYYCILRWRPPADRNPS